MKTRVAISTGDPLGIGPEVAVLALHEARISASIEPTLYGSRKVLERAAALRGVALAAHVVDIGEQKSAGASALAALEAAMRAVAKGDHAALCTAPVSKERVALAAPGFVGHTEHLAAFTGARVAMMMAGPRLRVVLATNHVRLRDVPEKLSAEHLASVMTLTNRELSGRFGIPQPRIAVCGLNPHAGDGGLFGDEEERLLRPAIRLAREHGADVSGPFAADGLFPRAVLGHWDAVIALYHDQGLIPAKLLDFNDTVNVTLGLPWPRTSPDHGTADDIAWKGVADPRPMVAALLLAAKLGAAARRGDGSRPLQ